MLQQDTMNQVIIDKEIFNRRFIRRCMILIILLQTVISAIFPISAVQAEDNAVTTGTNPTKAYVLITDKEYTADGAKILQYSELTAGTESGTGTFNPESIIGTWGTDYH